MYKIILIITTIIIITACSSTPRAVGSVNGRSISHEEFVNLFMNNLDNFYIEHLMLADDEQRARISDETWQRFVEGYTMLDLYSRYNITVSAREVIDTLRTNIPDFILESPRFQDPNGAFDNDRYFNSLVSDNPVNMVTLRNLYQSTYIPQRKLQKAVIAQRTFSDREINNYHQTKNTTATIELFTFSEETIDRRNIDIPDREIEEYYNANRSDFYVEAEIDFNWVEFVLEPSERDRNLARAIADSLYKELNLGLDFHRMASMHSAQPYARLQGRVGILEFTDFPPAVAERLQEAEVGDILPPIFYDNAWWIYKIEERTRNTIRPYIIKIDIRVSRETFLNAQRLRQGFIELSNMLGFRAAAEELQIQMHEEKRMSLTNSEVEGLGDITGIIIEAMRFPDRTIMSPITVVEDEYYVIFQIDRRTPGYFRTVYAVMEEISEILTERKLPEYLAAEAERYRRNPNSLNPQRETLDIDFYTTRFPASFLADVLALNPNQTSSVHTEGNMAYYARMIHKEVNPDAPSINLNRNQLIVELQELNKDQFYEDWLNEQKTKAKIKDKRPRSLK